MDIIEYRPGLATWELIVEVRQLLATERRAERLVCRYLADLADRVQQRQDLALARYADELHAARSCFGLGAREARERIRVGRALRQLTEIERVFVAGELSYSRVREVTRIAVAADESEWLELARRLDMRALERRVAAARVPELDDEVSSFETLPMTRPRTRRVTFELSGQAYELLQQALEATRSLSGECSDAEALERLAQEALSARARITDTNLPAGTTRPANTAHPASNAHPANTASPRAEPARTIPSRAEPKPVRPWSWDELGWGATQRGSSDNDDDGTSAGAPGGRATQESGDDTKGAGAPGGRATQCGSWESDGDDEGQVAGAVEVEVERREVREREHWSEINTRLLQAMGGKGRWIADTLIEASGLSASQVSCALTFLQLSGRIRRRAGAFEPI